jgi:hypothetical protein
LLFPAAFTCGSRRYRCLIPSMIAGSPPRGALVLPPLPYIARALDVETGFGARSCGLSTRCLRFAGRVTAAPRKTRFRLVANPLPGRPRSACRVPCEVSASVYIGFLLTQALPGANKVQFTASEEHAKLVEEAKALLSHSAPHAGLDEIHLRAMRALVAELKRQKYAVSVRPRQSARALATQAAPARETHKTPEPGGETSSTEELAAESEIAAEPALATEIAAEPALATEIAAEPALAAKSESELELAAKSESELAAEPELAAESEREQPRRR